VHDFNNYSSTLHQAQSVLNLTKTILISLNYFTNNNVIVKNSKNYHFFSRLLNYTQLYKNMKDLPSFTRTFYLKKQNKALPKLHLNLSDVICEFSSKLIFSRFIFLLFSPKLITYYLIKQMREPVKLKDKNFTKGLQIALLKIANFFLFMFKNNINGLKIQCAGK